VNFTYRATVDLIIENELDDPLGYFEQALYYGDKHQDFCLNVNGDVVLAPKEKQ
jgi:hypothetical protein